MFDQEDLYEDYRKKLISDSQLQAKIKEAYRDTADEVNSYVEKGTVFWICISAFAAGFLLACYYMVASLSSWYKILFSCLTFGGFLACTIIGGMLYSKFKKALGRTIYFTYVENKLISDKVHQDQMSNLSAITRELQGNCIDLDWGINALKSNDDPIDTIKFIEKVSHKISLHEQKISQIEAQSHYPQQLSSDYQFTKIIYEYVHK